MNIPNIAIILAGGQGTRLQSITADKIPKVLIPVNGKPVIEHVIENLCLSQIRKIIITTHHLVDAFDLLASGWEQKYRVKIHLLKEPKPLGTGGSIRFARDAINIAKPFVLTNGDTLCNARVATLMRSRGFPDSVVMTLVPRRDPELNRIASLGAEGRVIASKLYPDRDEILDHPQIAGETLVNAGFYLVSPQSTQLIPTDIYSPIDDWLKQLTAQNQLYAIPTFYRYFNVGTPEALAEAIASWSNSPNHQESPEVQTKRWGQKTLVSQTAQFSVYRLQFSKGASTSLHKHRHTTKSHYVTDGVFRVGIGETSIILGPGQELTIEKGLVHVVTALTHGSIIEVTTEPKGTEDIVRLDQRRHLKRRRE